MKCAFAFALALVQSMALAGPTASLSDRTANALAHVVSRLNGLPENCGAPMAEAMETQAIPQLLKLQPGAAKIARIVALSPVIEAQAIGDQAGEITCAVTVYWTNGHVDRNYLFIARSDRYGNTTGYYGPLDAVMDQ
jgi:hypothetical protein